MSSLIIFIVSFLISNKAYFGANLMVALGVLSAWYLIVAMPLCFMLFTHIASYFGVMSNPNCVKIDPNANITREKAMEIIHKSYGKGLETITKSCVFLFIKVLLTVLSIYFISPTAVSFSALSAKAVICFSLLMTLNIYHFIKGLQRYL